MREYIIVLLLFLIFIIPVMGFAQPADSPWPVPRHDNHNTGKSAHEGPSILEKAWTYKTQGLIEGAPVIGTDGSIYVACHDSNVYAFYPDGSLKWTFSTLDIIRGAPAIGQDGTVYFGSYDKCIYAINSSDGSLKWCRVTDGVIASSPNISNDGTIIICNHSGRVFALNPDGTLIWQYKTDLNITTSSPAIADDGTIYIGGYKALPGSAGNLYAINPDGTLKWTYSADASIRSFPSIDPDNNVYVGARDGVLYALNGTTGSLLWKFVTGNEIRSSTAIDSDGTIYAGSYDGNLYAVNPDGTLKWKYSAGDPIETSPVIDSNGVIYFGAISGCYYAVNPDGSLRDKISIGVMYTTPALGSNGTLYGAFDFWIVALGPSVPPPYYPENPQIKIIIDKLNYNFGDTLNISLRVINFSGESVTADIKSWITHPGDTVISIFNKTKVNIPNGTDTIIPIFSQVLNSLIDEGAYMIGARLLNFKSGDYINHDFKIFTYN